MSLPGWATNKNFQGKQAFTSSITAIASGGVRFVCGIISIVILGRILTPQDFGLIGMILPILTFVTVFADGGLSSYTLQSKEINQKSLSLTFWLGAILCGFIFTFFVALSPLIAIFYNEEKLTFISIVLSSSILLTIFTNQHNALCKKSFRQDLLAIAEISSAIFSLICGVFIALFTGNYWALVAIPISKQIIHAIIIWKVTRWVPTRFNFDKKRSIKILSFGFYTSLSLALFTLGRSVDKILIGWKFNPTELGFYTMAFSIMMIPSIQILTPVGGAIVPFFSQFKEDKFLLNKHLHDVIIYIGIIIVPLMLWASYISPELITTVLGQKWAGASKIFSALALASIAITLSIPAGWTLTAFGKAKSLAIWTGLSVIPTIGAFIIGLKWGALGVALSFMIVNWVLLFLFPFYASKFSLLGFYIYIKAIFKVLIISIIAFIIVVLFTEYLYEFNNAPLKKVILSFLTIAVITPLISIITLGKSYVKNIINLIKQ